MRFSSGPAFDNRAGITDRHVLELPLSYALQDVRYHLFRSQAGAGIEAQRTPAPACTQLYMRSADIDYQCLHELLCGSRTLPDQLLSGNSPTSGWF
jgi:hypothetical protein